MKTSYELIKKYVPIQENPETLAEKLTLNGLEVEGIETFGGKVENVVVGEIEKKEQHPNADKLTLCQVNVGDETLSIICGAKNHRQGDKVAVSKIGAVLPNGLKIKKTKLRGIASEGMICSRSELGLEEESEGVWILPDSAKIGESIRNYMPKEDTIYDVTVTSNRSDCLSTMGIAREVGIIESKNIRYPEISLKSKHEIQRPNISIESTDLCYRYASRIVKGIKVQESPEWLQEALVKYGARPINNIVDITNYVLFELGQPLHAFDLNKLDDQRIVVRKAKKGEKIVTLDDKERELEENMLIIADNSKPVAVAGVMGGLNSEVDHDSVDILLESAYFVPHSVRKTAKKLNIRSEASYRFERDIDPENIVRALDYATQLIQELAGGEASELTDVYPAPLPEHKVQIRPSFIKDILGFDLTGEKLEELFKLLEFSFEKKDKYYSLTFPTFRRDCTREIDAVEEIIRVYGYENLPETMYPIPTSPENLDTREKLDDKIRKLLLGFGISEAYNFSFMSQEEANKFNLMGEENLISLDNPLNKELTTMRTGLFPSLLKNLITNHEKGNFNIALFEIGKSFWKETSYLERKNLGILLSGSMIATNWTTGELDADFFYMKGILEELFTGLQRKDISFERSVNPFLHPGKTASLILNGVKIGFFGELHPDVMMDQDIKKPTFYAELNLDALERTPEEPISYRKRSKYPAVEREIAFIVDQDTPAGNLKEIIQKESLLIQKAEAFDVYTGKPVPEGKKSVAFSFILQAEDRTLTDEEINKIMNSIIDKAKNQLGASLREG